MDKDYGHIQIRLAELLNEKGLNKYRLSHKAEMTWKQINNYCNNEITRLDPLVLCKLCTTLECDINDLLVFVPASQDDND